jgi:hypothetical protein
VPRLCKIDVEGFELPVIRGLSHLISVIAIEYHTDEASIDRTRQCLELLRRLGDFQVNATAREDMSFILPTWTSIDAFLLEFPANVQSNHFGDLILWQR